MNQNIVDVSQALGMLLQKSKLTLTTAESCTGGGISYYLTAIPGSSTWFERGFVTYSNAAKTSLLHVPDLLLKQFGAVSEETAQAMAEGALKNSRADIALSVTGIAGPEGGSQDKPVGMVCFSIARTSGEIKTMTECFSGDRAAVRENSILYLLTQLASELDRPA
jgi:nicotinamide-nucleotide amidase